MTLYSVNSNLPFHTIINFTGCYNLTGRDKHKLVVEQFVTLDEHELGSPYIIDFVMILLLLSCQI